MEGFQKVSEKTIPKEREPLRISISGVLLEYGRTQEVLLEKRKTLLNQFGIGWWLPKEAKKQKLRENIIEKEIVARVTSEGVVKILDGNTTLYTALDLGLELSDIGVVYTLSPTLGGESEYFHANFSEFLVHVVSLKGV